MKQVIFKGCATALITPFKDNKLDEKALKKIVTHQLDNGVSSLVACGTTGEPPTLSQEEWEKVISICVKEVAGAVPVIAGTGSNNTLSVVEKAKKAEKLGAQAQLVVTPYYNKTTQEGLVKHFSYIAKNSDLPIIVYNVPSRTGMTIDPQTIAELSQIDNIVAVKEATSDLALLADMLNACNGELSFYSGSDESIMPFMALGGLGVISVLSNAAPKFVSVLTDLVLKGEYKRAAEMQVKAMPLIRMLFSKTSPIPIKAAMSLMGLCENELRLPLVPMQDTSKLKQLMEELNLL
ncbi:MAG: 4-hydroxy-tetrahydrodipicolinate synthase [Eubacteriales bacterium]|nr:4-hydroxy-tetrahydrodipicolinate synthase [Eubacteriales bacterium]